MFKEQTDRKDSQAKCTNPVAPILNYNTQTKELKPAKCQDEMGWWPEGKCNMWSAD